MRWGVILLLAAVAALTMPAAGAAGKIQTGFLDPVALRADGPVAAQRMTDAGAAFARVFLNWREVAPTEPTDPKDPDDSAYKWVRFDRQLNPVLAQSGLKPMVYIVSAPDWAEGGSGEEGTVKPSPAALADFAEAAATRYSQVLHWQLWNEPNLHTYLNPQYDSKGRLFSPVWYRKMLNAFAARIHAVRPNSVVIAGGTSPYGGGPGRAPPLAFLRKMLCLSSTLKPSCKAKSRFDVWTTHPYTHGAPTRHAINSDDVAMGDLPDVQRVLKAGARAKHVMSSKGVLKRPGLWVTEISWDSKGPDTKAVPLRLHRRWTAEALYQMWRFRVGVAIWHLIRDQPFPATRWQSGFYYCGAKAIDDDGDGLACEAPFSSDVEKSDSLQAFRFPFVAYAGGGKIKVWGRVPPGVTGSVAIQRQKSNGAWRTWKGASIGSGGIFTKRWDSSKTSGYLRAVYGGFESADVRSSTPFSLKRPSSSLTYPAFGCGGAQNDC